MSAIIIIRPSFLMALIGLGSRIVITETEIAITGRHNDHTTIPLIDLVDLPERSRKLFGDTLSFRTAGANISVAYLKSADLQKALPKIEELARQHLTSSIQSAVRLFKDLTSSQYLRDSSVEIFRRQVFTLTDRFLSNRSKWSTFLHADLVGQLETLAGYSPIDNNIQRLRDAYELKVISDRQFFYDKIESNPLTVEQRQAVVRENDRNLVLAAAGTGKTSVIVAKALDLIDRATVEPSEILVLAYNNAAAQELRERLLRRAELAGLEAELQPEVMTFHALGRKILREAKVSTHLSVFVDDPIRLEMWLSDWLLTLLKNDPSALRDFIELSVQPVNPFEFKSTAEYERYIRDNEFRTLQGEKVRGYQELLIANWLFLNSVPYAYEPAYVSKRRIEVGFDYRPDFQLLDTDLYIEHFGVDRQGNTRADIDSKKYADGMKRKRALHAECGTRLIETYHYDWVEGNLQNRLEAELKEANIPMRSRPYEEVLSVLEQQGFLVDGVKRYLKCLQAIRLERLDHRGTEERLKDANIALPEKHASFLWDMVEAYRRELAKQNAIDFDDMIIRAHDAINNNAFDSKWSHILFDEFQDISGARMELLKALVDHGPAPCLTVVGDDWQAIYRFAGGKLELTTQFDKLVGSCTKTTLQKTFRYNNSIADVAGTFVMRNPEQYKKDIKTQDIVFEPQVYLLDSRVSQTKNELEVRTLQIIRKVRAHEPDGSIAVLSRYRYLLENTRNVINEDYPDNIKYWTFHGAKGLEADYCILIGFFQDKSGFPNQNTEEAVVEALLPSLDGYPHSEERRLLYVALTRARKISYIVADSTAPSEFVNELLSPLYEIAVGSKTFQNKIRAIYKCPGCSDGYLRARSGKFGLFYTCSSEVACNIKPRVCEKCKAPSIDGRNESRCNNRDCGERIKICSECGRTMKLRNGRFGSFWGCSGYGLKEDRCTRTEKVAAVI